MQSATNARTIGIRSCGTRLAVSLRLRTLLVPVGCWIAHGQRERSEEARRRTRWARLWSSFVPTTPRADQPSQPQRWPSGVSRQVRAACSRVDFTRFSHCALLLLPLLFFCSSSYPTKETLSRFSHPSRVDASLKVSRWLCGRCQECGEVRATNGSVSHGQGSRQTNGNSASSAIDYFGNMSLRRAGRPDFRLSISCLSPWDRSSSVC